MAVSVFLMRMLDRPVPIDVMAERLTRAMFEGDARTIVSCVPDYELKKIGVSRSVVSQILAQEYLPRLRAVKFLGVSEHYLQRGGTSGVAVYRVKLASGRVLELTTVVELSDDGVLMQFSTTIDAIWLITYLNEHGGATSSVVSAYAAGLKRDFAMLNAYHIHCFAPDNEKSNPRTLAWLLSFYQRLEKLPNGQKMVWTKGIDGS